MSLFAIGDTHLSFACDKPMNIFEGWSDHERRLEKHWRAAVTQDDTVVIAGDVSWGMDLRQALPDFEFLHSLPGQKILLKGNHDYWWNSKSKMDALFARHGLSSLRILHNNAYAVGPLAVCGTRGWIFDNDSEDDQKIRLREAGRLQASLNAAASMNAEPVVFLHYPPLGIGGTCREILDVLIRGGVKRCYYGHLHAQAVKSAVIGTVEGVQFGLISGDYLEFCPKLIAKF